MQGKSIRSGRLKPTSSLCAITRASIDGEMAGAPTRTNVADRCDGVDAAIDAL